MVAEAGLGIFADNLAIICRIMKWVREVYEEVNSKGVKLTDPNFPFTAAEIQMFTERMKERKIERGSRTGPPTRCDICELWICDCCGDTGESFKMPWWCNGPGVREEAWMIARRLRSILKKRRGSGVYEVSAVGCS